LVISNHERRGTKLLNGKPTSPMKRTERSPTMRLTAAKKTASLLIGLVLIMLATQSVATAPLLSPPPLPNPVLYMTGQEVYQVSGTQYTRYRYDVLNKGDYPAAVFASVPPPPPCGHHTTTSPTWVH